MSTGSLRTIADAVLLTACIMSVEHGAMQETEGNRCPRQDDHFVEVSGGHPVV